MIALGITGTDTGVGKTVVACALAAAYVQLGARVGVMKPVETGVSPGASSTDAARLTAASQSADSPELIAPYVYAAPLAPLAAARSAGRPIDLERLDYAFNTISGACDVVIVEGAGGLLVPLTDECTFDALCARWTLRLVVVAANRLGVLNHTLLTLRAAAHAAIPVGAIVLNEVAHGAADSSSAHNPALLGELVPGIPLALFPWMASPDDYGALARAAQNSGVVAHLGLPAAKTARASLPT